MKKRNNYKQVIIDSHTHLGYWPSLNIAKNNLLESMSDHNISFSIVSFDGSEFKEEGRFNKLIPQLNATKKLLAITKEHKNLLPLIWIRPHTEENIEDLEAFLIKHHQNIYGLKFHPYTSRLRISDPRVKPYLDLAKKYRLPVLVHTATDKHSLLKYLIHVAKEYKDVTFIAAHAILNGNNSLTIPYLKSLFNLYVDTAWVDISFISKLKEENLLDKVLFGTDNPIDGYETLNNPIYENYFNNTIKLTKQEYDKLMYKNALKVYNLNLKDLLN